jgi:hypothetical protein
MNDDVEAKVLSGNGIPNTIHFPKMIGYIIGYVTQVWPTYSGSGEKIIEFADH